MRRQWFLMSGFVTAALIASCASSAHHAAPVSEEEMGRRWMEFMTPGSGHQVLNERAGNWKLEIKFWMPGSPEAMASSGTSSMRWILDGRYLEDRTQASNPMGLFEGRGIVGFDNLTKKYFSTWIDTSGTGLSTSTGDFDTATHTFHFTVKMPDPTSGQYITARTAEKRIDADRWVAEMFQPGPDGEYRCLELTYTRQ